ncbi:uncharacterized protein LOC102706691 [Oryza brachyantha]|uniref:Uncharacterized protein n=1 Tax=Oryza brachyantha TaxID=4533 RepID=J3KXF6_ORYBR|nr:uncharacterized protein LOC102706691 [Oryza brachyantha]
MALSAARRLSSSTAGAAAAPQPGALSSLFAPRSSPKPRSPHSEPGDGPRERRKPRPRPKPRRPWGQAATALLRRFYDGGYLPGPDLTTAPQVLSPDVVKGAAERFGHDHQVVAKWLSGSDLKTVALFGCPSVERRTVFASKRLRAFFNIQEAKTCSSCKLKNSCQFVNQQVSRHDKVILSDTMRIVTLFVLDAFPQRLKVTSELRASICKLVKDTINLSQ